MVETVKVVASAAATIIALVAYIPYLIDMFRGKNHPHLYTWISFFLVTVVVAIIQVVGGAGIGAIPTILGSVVNGLILFYCFKFGTRDIIFIDKVCLIGSVAGVVAYAVFNSQPVVSLVLVTVAEVVSFLPTVRKTKKDPYSESLPSYYLSILKFLLILAALQQYNILTVSYHVTWLVVFVSFLGATYYWRTRSTQKPTRGSVIEDTAAI